MDEPTMEAVRAATVPRMRDFSCIAWELPEDLITTFPLDPEAHSEILTRVLEGGERILDIMRLFLFKPGEDISIGRVGSLGGGVSGVWLGDDGTHSQFIARKTSRFQLVQQPLQRGLKEIRRIYTDEVFRELRSVVCSGTVQDETLALILNSLRTFRQSPTCRAMKRASCAWRQWRKIWQNDMRARTDSRATSCAGPSQKSHPAIRSTTSRSRKR